MKRVRVGPDDPRRQKIVALVGEAAFAKTGSPGAGGGMVVCEFRARGISATPTVA